MYWPHEALLREDEVNLRRWCTNPCQNVTNSVRCGWNAPALGPDGQQMMIGSLSYSPTIPSLARNSDMISAFRLPQSAQKIIYIFSETSPKDARQAPLTLVNSKSGRAEADDVDTG